MKPIPRSVTLLGAGLAALLTSCIFDDKQASNRGTVVDNELRVGSIYLADGSPAVGARVRVFPVDYVPDSSSTSLVFSTRTDSKGRYIVDSLPTDQYNILAESDGVYSYQDSVNLRPSTDTIPADTLDRPGSMTGVVRLQPQHDPRTLVVQVFGTNTFVNVGDDGRFTLSGLAEGKYSLRLLTTIKEYTQLFTSISIRKGKTDTLKDTLRPLFTGIPVVQGITASYDTAKGVVTLKWKPVKYRDSIEYVVYRDVTPVLSPSLIPLSLAQETIFRDTLAKTPGGFTWGSGSVSLEYRVKVQNLSLEIGPSYGKARVVVVNPDELGTKVRIDTAWAIWDPVRKKDSVVAVAVLTSTKPITDSLYWFAMDTIGFGFHTPRQLKLDGGPLVRDTLRFDVTGSQSVTLIVRAKDGTGRNREDSTRVQVNSPPQFMTSWENPVPINLNSDFMMEIPTYDPDGDPMILTAEGLPAWLKLEANGVLHGTPTAADTGDYPDILLKLKDSRHTVVRTLKLRVAFSPWAQPDSTAFGALSPSLAALGGRLFAFNPTRSGNDGNVQVYDTAVGHWMPSSKPWSFRNRVAMPYAGKILLAGNDDSLAAATYDTATGVLKFLARTSYIIPEQTLCASAGGKLYCFGPPSVSVTPKSIVREYDPALDKWQAKKDVPFRFPNAAVTGSGGRLYVYAGDSLYVYDPAVDAWSRKTPPMGDAKSTALCALGGNVVLASSPNDSGRVTTELQAFNPVAETWTLLSSSTYSQSDFSCSEIDSRLYLVGGKLLFRSGNGYGSLYSGVQIYDGRPRP